MRKPAHPFRETKTLAEMSTAEWESLCNGCGKCCLGNVDDPDGQGLCHTSVACRLLDPDTCQCSSYEDRHRFVPDCVRITPRKLAKLAWLPSTCACRLLAEGAPLAEWHPLVTGDAESVHAVGKSARERMISTRDVDITDIPSHIADWLA
jgi:uncharacterized cysteine cluster protein YcgN (CxxCxxCC family)